MPIHSPTHERASMTISARNRLAGAIECRRRLPIAIGDGGVPAIERRDPE
jgi:hypothetical protein